jgi:hypothetical protein
MPSRSLWSPLVVCEIEVGPLGQRSLCCGITANGIPCKNSVKIKDINQAHQKMTDLSRIPFGLAALQASVRSPKTFSASDGTGIGRRTGSVNDGTKQLFGIRLRHIVLPRTLHVRLLHWPSRARHDPPSDEALRNRTGPIDSWIHTLITTATEKPRQRLSGPTLGQPSELVDRVIPMSRPRCCERIMFHGALLRLNRPFFR